jgi:cyclic pyranopterin phosphate synthase
MTTNGIPLALQARSLYEAGLRRLNVHVDTLDRQRFLQITRRDQLPDVLKGLEAARSAGFNIKINAVAVKNLVEPDIVPLALFGRERGFEVRYIEFMPLDAQHLWERAKVLTAAEIISTISREVCPLEPVPDPDPRAPASEYRYTDGKGRIGVIASVTRPFASTATGSA